MSEQLPIEVKTVFDTYTKSKMSRLGILRSNGDRSYLKAEAVDIPPLAFLYCLLYYRDTYSPGSSAMNIVDICTAENSPGRVFNCDEYQVRTVLDGLHDLGLIRLEKQANLDQVRFSDFVTQEKVLQQIYRGDNAY